MLIVIGAVGLVGVIAIVYFMSSDHGFPPSSGKLGGDKGLRPPR